MNLHQNQHDQLDLSHYIQGGYKQILETKIHLIW